MKNINTPRKTGKANTNFGAAILQWLQLLIVSFAQVRKITIESFFSQPYLEKKNKINEAVFNK